MKRSKMLTLLLMGSLSAGGCGSDSADEGTYTFNSLDECYRSAIFSEAECRDLAKTALDEAPLFTSREDCEARFGKDACQDAPRADATAGTRNGTAVQPQSGGMWMPMMMGFMAGRFMSGGAMMRGSQGLYRDPAATQGRSFRTAGGETVSPGADGKVAKPTQSMTRAMTHTAKPAVSRSGFGRSGGFSGGSSFGGGAS